MYPVQQGSKEEQWAETPSLGKEADRPRCALTRACCEENSKDTRTGCVRTESGSLRSPAVATYSQDSQM